MKAQIPTTAKTKTEQLEVQLRRGYETWKAQPSPLAAGQFVDAASPLTDSVLNTIGNKSPLMRSAAKAILVDALPKYDSSRGVPVGSFLRIQLQPLHRIGAEQASDVPLPERRRRQAAAVSGKMKELRDGLGREPNETEVSDSLGISPAKIRSLLTAPSPVVESSFVDEEGAPRPPAISRPSRDDLLMAYVYHDLDPAGRRLFEMLRDGWKKSDIAKALGVSSATITVRAARLAHQFEKLSDVYEQKAAAEVRPRVGSILFRLPSALAEEIREWGRHYVSDLDLVKGEGRGRVQDPHLTIKHGLFENQKEATRDLVRGFGEFEIMLGDVTRFTSNEDFDVLKIDVWGHKLAALNELLCSRIPHVDFHRRYRPHVTVAFVRKGTAVELSGVDDFRGRRLTVRIVEYRAADGQTLNIRLNDQERQ